MSSQIPGGPSSNARRGLLIACALPLALMAWHIQSAYWQCDDAYISFRYVRNFVDGHGLVFNPGEYVEGYTNFAWVIELAWLWKWFDMRPAIGANVLSLLFTAGSIACVAALVWRIRVDKGRYWVLFGTLLLLATSFTWAVWSTSGLETRQFTFFVLLGIVLIARAGFDERRLLGASLAFVGAALTRPDGTLLWACAGAWLIVEMIIARRFAWKSALAYGVPFVALVGAHFVWRHAYYGDWFPNTYYAKYLRAWPEAGFRYFAAGGIECGAWFMLPLALVGAIHRTRLGDRAHWLGAIVVTAHMAYLVRIGGDQFEWRPMDFYWPLLMIAAVEGIWTIAKWMERRVNRQVGWIGGVVLMSLTTLYGAIIQRAKIDMTMPFDTRANSYALMIKFDPDEHAWLRRIPPLAPLIDVYNELQAYLLPRGVAIPWRETERFWRDELRNWSPYEKPCLEYKLPSDAVTLRAGTGVSGFCLPRVVLLDLLGLTDRFVARLPPARENENRYMAHDRRAPMSYLEERGFNIYFWPASESASETFLSKPYAIRVSETLWLPFNSTRPEWVRSKAGEVEIWALAVEKEIGCFRAGVEHGWTSAGEPLKVVPLPAVPPSSLVTSPLLCDASYGFSTRAPDQGGKGVGRSVSPKFRISKASLLEVRMCGIGAGCKLRVVDASGEELGTLSPQDPELLLPMHLSLEAFAGREAFVEVVDSDDDSWIQFGGVVLAHPAPLQAH